MKFENYMILDFPSKSANEAFARSAVACFAAQKVKILHRWEHPFIDPDCMNLL